MLLTIMAGVHGTYCKAYRHISAVSYTNRHEIWPLPMTELCVHRRWLFIDKGKGNDKGEDEGEGKGNALCFSGLGLSFAVNGKKDKKSMQCRDTTLYYIILYYTTVPIS